MRKPITDRSSGQAVDLKKLQQFVAVVEAGSLTEAAAVLGVTQQALSAAVRGLEHQVGVELFRRSKGMTPSAAGRRLYMSAQVLLAGADRAVADARSARGEVPHVLTVAHTPPISSVAALDIVSGSLPRGSVAHFVQTFPPSLRNQLMAGEADLALQRGISKPEGLDGAIVEFHRLNVAVRMSEFGYPDEAVGLEDLKGKSLILWAPAERSEYASYLLSQCRRSGFEPATVVSGFQGLDPIAAPLVNPGGFAFVTADPGSYMAGRIRVLKMTDTVFAPVQALWLPSARSGLIGETVASLSEASRIRAVPDSGG